MDLSTVVVLVLLATVALRVALVLGIVWLLVPRRGECPRCGAATLLLVTATALRRLHLERRWCLCGWMGLSKRVPAPRDGLREPAAQAGGEWAGDEWKARWDDDDQWKPSEADGWR